MRLQNKYEITEIAVLFVIIKSNFEHFKMGSDLVFINIGLKDITVLAGCSPPFYSRSISKLFS